MATIPAALRPRLSRRTIASLLVAALGVPLVAGAGWIAFSSDSILGDMEVRAIGDVTVLRDGEALAVDEMLELRPHDLITTGQGSSALFNLEGARSVELAQHSSARVLAASSVAVESGRSLIESSDRTKVMIGDVEVVAPAADTVFRLDRTSVVRAGVYEGVVTVGAPGENTLRVPRLYETSVPLAAPDVLSRPAPYSLNPTDHWDETHLPSVVALQEQLSQTAKGLAPQFGKKTLPLSYFSAIAGTDVRFMQPYLKGHRTTDLLVGLTVAKGTPSMKLAPAFRETLGLFDRGAQWGVAAAIMQAKPKTLLAGLNNLLEKSGLGSGKGNQAAMLALAGSTRAGAAGANGVPSSVTTGTGPEGGPSITPTIDPTTDPTTPPPTDSPTDEPTNPPTECTNEIECAVNDFEPPVDNPLEDDLGEKLGGGGGGTPSTPKLP